MINPPGGSAGFDTLLDTVTDTLVWLTPVSADLDQPADFVLTYGRPAAGGSVSWLPDAAGQRLLDTPTVQPTRQVLATRLHHVMQTGKPSEDVLQDDRTAHWYQTTCTRLGEGVLVVLRHLPGYQPPVVSPPTLPLLDSLIDSVQIGLLLLGPVRNEAGAVVDLVYTLANDKALQILGRSRADTVGRTLLAMYPGSDTFEFPGGNTGESMLGRYIRQLREGGSSGYEFLYDRDGLHRWFQTTAQTLADRQSLVISFIDVTASKEAEQARQALLNTYERQTSFLQALIDASPNGIVAERAIRDEAGAVVDFQILSANQSAATIVQSSVDQLVGSRDLDLHPNLIESGVFAKYVAAVDTGVPQHIETYYHDGRLDFWVNIDVHRIMENELLITFNDVSAIRRIARDRQQQAELLSNVLDASTNGIMSFDSVRDKAGQITDFVCRISNAAAGRLVGRTETAVLGEPLSELFPEVVSLGLFTQYIDTVETGTPLNTEFHIVYQGTDIYWTVSARKLNDGFVVTFADVSELRLATLAVEASVQRLQAVIDHSQTAIILMAPIYDAAGDLVDFRYRAANEALTRYVGKSPADLVGTPVSQWFGGYREEGYAFGYYRAVFLTGQPARFTTHYTFGGLDIWLDIAATRLGDEVLISFSDFTSLKQVQQQLESSIVDLQRSNRNLEQFAYVASHDLQEPLRKIRTFGDMLQASYQTVLGTDGTAIVDRMQLAAGRMQTLIRDVLAYSRITTQRDTVGPVALQQLVGEVLTDLETTITDRQARLDIGPLPVVQGDAVQLRQLFQNLISNALKFQRPTVPPALTITCQTIHGRDADLTVSAADEGRLFHQIELTDNGIGFEEKYADQIFQVFQRLHGRSQYEGTGIGLAIVEKVIQNHHGYIRAEGRPGAGATFRLLLPA